MASVLRFILTLRINRTRVQILLGFLLVMIVVLSVAGGMLYHSSSELVIESSEDYLEEIATQASARVDALLAQLDTTSLQVIMDSRIQSLLYQSKHGIPATIDQKLSIRPILDNLVALSWLVHSIDIYTDNEPLYPLENQKLSDLIGADAVSLVNRKSNQLVWVGTHPDEPELLLAVRQIHLEQDYLAGGGYVVIKVMNTLLDFFNTEFTTIKGSSMHLYGQNNLLMASTNPGMLEEGNLNVTSDTQIESNYPIVSFDDKDYLHIIKHSKQYDWSIHILVSLDTITERISLLKNVLLYALLAGFLVCIVLLWVLSSLITLPISKLRKVMRNVHYALPQQNNETYFNFEMNELNTSYNKLVDKLHYLVGTVYENERLKNLAEIKMLQAQIHPHFLFNTLETLYWSLIDKEDHDGANLVIALSKLFRYTIKTVEGDDWSMLSDEIEHCRRYLEIMKYRLADRLRWNIKIDHNLENVRVPKLLIQPIVENAIQHGIERKIGNGSVKILIRSVANDTLLHIQITDDGPGMNIDQLKTLNHRIELTDIDPVSASGIGLVNVNRRIKLYYGETYGLQINSIPDTGTEVNVYLPNGS